MKAGLDQPPKPIASRATPVAADEWTRLPDWALVEHARLGDQDAMNHLFNRHLEVFRRHARLACDNWADAEDVCQSACHHAVVHLSELQHPGAFRAWVQTLIAHEAWHWRSRAQKVGTLEVPKDSYYLESMNVEGVSWRPWSTVPQSSLTATQVVVNGLLQTESTPTVPQPTSHAYDSLGREIGVTDPLGNHTGTQYDPVTGQVTATINPHGLGTSIEYFPAGATNAGLVKCLTGPTGKKTYYNYNGCGQPTRVWGDVPYPEEREYNEFGDQITLTTYRGGSGWSGPTWPANTGQGDVTHWYYDEPTGLLTNKTDAAGHAVTYDYYDNWFPKTRIWARGVASTNLYGPNGDLVHIDYSDGTSVSFTNETIPWLNRLAKPALVIDASGTNLRTYDHAARLLATTCTDGLLAGITVTNHFDRVHGRDGLWVRQSNNPLTQQSFAHDSCGRMASVSSGVYSAPFGYLPNCDLLQTTTCRSNATVVLTTTRTHDTGPRLREIANSLNGTVVSSHSYYYDALSRRTRAALEDGSVWMYDYNDRDELTGARRFWPDWAPASGKQFGNDYDSIGNRQTASSGGDTTGDNLRQTTYAANSLNQYTSITTPGYKDICGVALATNTVTVNGGVADRKVEYFHREIPVANTNAPLWQEVTVTSGGATNTGGLPFPANNQTLTYDPDGNLSFDGTWNYEWDGENRLVVMTMTNLASLANSNRFRLEFAYDFQGRRVQKIVAAWDGSTFVPQSPNRFVHDGWNLVAELLALSPQELTLMRSYAWGQDLSGTMDQAGGVGALLLLTFHGASDTNCFVSYDGNGDIAALINPADGSKTAKTARYEYSPFGELLRATGPMAKANPFRFSTKYVDDESALIYYGYRYYSPALGRWISRDPAEEEEGGNNLFRFCENNALSGIDTDGRIMIHPVGSPEYWYQKMITAYQNIEISKLFKDTTSQTRALFDYKWAKLQLNRSVASTAARVGGQFGARWGLGGVGGFVSTRLLGAMGTVVGGVGIGLAAGFVFGLVVDQASDAVGTVINAMQAAAEQAVDYYASTGIKWLDD